MIRSRRSDSTKPLTLGWARLSSLVTSVANAVQADGPPELIVCIQRGGFVPAVLLSHLLSVRELEPFNVRITTSDRPYSPKLKAPVVAGNLPTRVRGSNVLLVDDVIGSGRTMAAARMALWDAGASLVRVAVVVVNVAAGDGDSEIDYLGIRTNRWVVFPWELSPARLSGHGQGLDDGSVIRHQGNRAMEKRRLGRERLATGAAARAALIKGVLNVRADRAP
jgi:uncharacterized protein